jgi:hypothetical protein
MFLSENSFIFLCKRLLEIINTEGKSSLLYLKEKYYSGILSLSGIIGGVISIIPGLSCLTNGIIT